MTTVVLDTNTVVSAIYWPIARPAVVWPDLPGGNTASRFPPGCSPSTKRWLRSFSPGFLPATAPAPSPGFGSGPFGSNRRRWANSAAGIPGTIPFSRAPWRRGQPIWSPATKTCWRSASHSGSKSSPLQTFWVGCENEAARPLEFSRRPATGRLSGPGTRSETRRPPTDSPAGRPCTNRRNPGH